MPLIYCVEDDESIRELVSYAMRGQGYKVEGFGDSGEFYEAVKKDVPDLILLDIMLPGEDGLSILKKIRSAGPLQNVPVIMMTAKTTEFDIVQGLDLGADDYVTKPFGIMELLSRIRSVLRRTKKALEAGRKLLTYSKISVDQEQHIVTVDGKEVQLTLKEFDLLCYLILNKGIVLSRDQIMQAGLIKLKNGNSVDASVTDITENPKNLQFVELDAAQIPRSLDDTDLACVNTNYAIPAGLNPQKDSILVESKDSPYANVMAVRQGDENNETYKKVLAIYQSEPIKKFIEEHFQGTILPAF